MILTLIKRIQSLLQKYKHAQVHNSLLPYPSLTHSGTDTGELEPSGDRDGVASELSNS